MCVLLGAIAPQAIAQEIEANMTEDELITIFGIPWAARGWRFSRIVEVRDSLDGSPIGRVVLDRHGEDRSGSVLNDPFAGIIRDPFASPLPGRVVMVSAWGSNTRGCYVELLLLAALDNRPGNAARIIPTSMEMSINGQRINLQPQSNQGARYSDPLPFRYSDYVTRNGNRVEVPSQGYWYVGRHLFSVDARTANLLSSAPDENVNVRITLNADNRPIIAPIGNGTVQRWKHAYSANPSCSSISRIQPLTPAVAAPPTAAPSQPQPVPAADSPAAAAPALPPSASMPQGNVALGGGQTVNDVTMRIDGAYVQNSGSYIANLVIDNRSDRTFGFVPLFARVKDEEGRDVRVRLRFDVQGDIVVRPGESLRGELFVINRQWNPGSAQGLTLFVREGTTGGREFEMSF